MSYQAHETQHYDSFGLTAKKIVYPVWGRKQDLLTFARRHPIHIFVASVGLAALALAAGFTVSGWHLSQPWSVLALAIVAAFAERGSVRLGSTTEQSISLLPMLFAATLFGPQAAAIVGAASMLGDPEFLHPAAPGRQPLLKWATYTSSRFLIGGAMGLIGISAASAVPSNLGSVVAAALAGAFVGETLNVGFAGVTAHVRKTRSVSAVLKTHAPLVLVSAPLYAPLVAALTVAYVDISPWTLPMFFVPALAAQRLFHLYQQERRLAHDLRVANDHLERAGLSFAAALIATLDARDPYTAGHSAAVAIYSHDIARRMGLSPEVQKQAHLCGLVHDMGKVALPAGLLEKRGPLTLEERRAMQAHPEIGERILSRVDGYSEIATIVRLHHERVDGNGYPDGLAYDDIPLLSRIIAVADAYNAMTSDRPYREAMPSRVARLRLAQAVDSQFDTSVVAAFEAILAGSSEDYRLGRSDEFGTWASQENRVAHDPLNDLATAAGY